MIIKSIVVIDGKEVEVKELEDKSGVVAEEILWEKKPLTLAQVEKIIGKKDFADAVGEFVTQKPGKPTLVEASDKRQAITNKVTAQEAFKEEN